MSEILLPLVLLGGWTIFSISYLRKAYASPASVNPYILDTIPSVFPTLGIMCTAIGIAYGLADFDPNNIQDSLPRLLGGLKSAFYATIAGIAGLIIFQKALAFVQNHIDASPDRPRQSSDELTALDGIITYLATLERSLREDLQKVNESLIVGDKRNGQRLDQLSQLIIAQTDHSIEHHLINVQNGERTITSLIKLESAQRGPGRSYGQRAWMLSLAIWQPAISY